MKCLVWSRALYAAKKSTLTQRVRRLEASQMWIWRKMQKISCLIKLLMRKFSWE